MLSCAMWHFCSDIFTSGCWWVCWREASWEGVLHRTLLVALLGLCRRLVLRHEGEDGAARRVVGGGQCLDWGLGKSGGLGARWRGRGLGVLVLSGG